MHQESSFYHRYPRYCRKRALWFVTYIRDLYSILFLLAKKGAFFIQHFEIPIIICNFAISLDEDNKSRILNIYPIIVIRVYKCSVMKILKAILVSLFLSRSMVSAFADVPFNGLILDREMKPKKGVKVFVKNPKRYSTSDKQGRFGLTDVEPDDTLTLVLSKKESIRIPVAGCKGMRIVISGDTSAYGENDEELVNIGYGYVKRREHTGVSSGISGDRLRSTGGRDILSALKGLVPGLNINGSNGNYSVNIRGVKSLNFSNEPLYIVDGVTVSSLDFVSIYDVEYVEVLKDAYMYGSRGANGAILVTTKKGPK